MRKFFIFLALNFSIFLVSALPGLAKEQKDRQTTDKPEFLESVEIIAHGSTMAARETNLVHVTIAPLKLIFTISF